MGATTKFKITSFLVFNYDKEEDYLNSMSHKGWQLKNGGMFHHTYEKDDTLYRYRLDFNSKVKFNSDELGRYLSIYRDQGWEHISSTLNGWHYFRKKYIAEADEQEYQLYTDNSSLMEMLGKWMRMARFLQVMMLLMLLFYIPMLFTSDRFLAIMDCIISISGFLMMQLAISALKRKRINPKSKTKSIPASIAGYLLLFTMVFSMVLLIFVINYEPNVYHSTLEVGPGTVNHVDTVNLKSGGRYGLIISSKSSGGSALIEIFQGSQLVFKSGGEGNSEAWMKLSSGKYRIETLYYPEDYDSNYSSDYSKQTTGNASDGATTSGKVKVSIRIKKSLTN